MSGQVVRFIFIGLLFLQGALLASTIQDHDIKHMTFAMLSALFALKIQMENR